MTICAAKPNDIWVSDTNKGKNLSQLFVEIFKYMTILVTYNKQTKQAKKPLGPHISLKQYDIDPFPGLVWDFLSVACYSIVPAVCGNQ